MFKNQVYEHVQSGRRVRILDLEQPTQTVWTFNLHEPKALPRAYAVDELRAAIADQQFMLVTGEPSKASLKPSKAATRRADAAYDCIAPLVQNLQIFEPARRSALVKARAEELKCSQQTIYKYLRTWWREGQRKNCLLPNFHLIGSLPGNTANRGRPPKYLERPIYQMTEADQKLIKAAAEKYFLADEKETVDSTYDALIREHYSDVDSEGRQLLRLPGERPSEAQFRRTLRKLFPADMVIRARKGDVHFELNHRPKLGSLRHVTYTVGDVYEIDATVADVFLVHTADRSRIIGKPVIYMVRDRKSNLCVGLYVTVENVSWTGALHAIKSISDDKADLCARYELPYSPADWPAHGVFPKEFIADRGPEMVSESSERLADGLECTILNLPRGRGDWKPHVECGFKLVQRSIASCAPGYVPPENFGKRQVRDHSKDAALTLFEFTRLMLAAVIRSNKKAMDSYALDPKYLLADMQPTPLNIWNAEIRDRAGLLTQYSEEEVRFALLPRTKATVSREGIRVGHCFYSADEAADRKWFVAAARGTFPVTVTYDRRMVDAVYVHDDRDPTQYFVAHLLEKCSHYRGMSFAEVESLEHLREVQRQWGEHARRQLSVDFRSQVDPMVTQAVTETKRATKGKSRSARKKDTVAARADVLKQQRQVEARIAPPPLAPTADVIPMARPSGYEPAQLPQQPQPATKSRQQRFQELMDGN